MNQSPGLRYEFGPFRLDGHERLLQREGVTISLTPKAFDLLLALIERRGRLVEKEELFQAVWPKTFVEESSLSSNIAHIRKTLGDGEDGLKLIETVPKYGYRFVADVRVVRSVQADSIPTVARSQADQIPLVTAPSAAGRNSRFARTIIFLTVGVIVSAAVWLIAFRRPTSLPPPRITPLTSFPGDETAPSFSPDGNQIAFVWNGEQGDNTDIYVKQVGIESRLRLTSDPAADAWPRWSPDGRHIAFMRRTGEGFALFLIPSLGGPERRITDLPLTSFLRDQFPASWSPDGEWLSVTDRLSPQEPFGIFLVSLETGEKRKLTVPPVTSSIDADAAISPDGKQVAFFRYNDLGSVVGDLHLVPMAGGEVRRLTFDQSAAVAPVWTHDGRKVLFVSKRGGGSDFRLWRVSVPGGAPEQVETFGRDLSDVAISRRGDRLAWVQTNNDRNTWRMELSEVASPAGRKQTPQSAKQFISSTRNDAQAQFSHDGQRIAYTSDRSGNWELWVCDGDGRQQQQLTTFNHEYVGAPPWSPDARQIVFSARAEGSADIYVIGADGGKPHRLTTENSADTSPVWSRDGQWIYFCSERSGSLQIWKMPAPGGAAVQVTKQGGLDPIESPDRRFLYYAKRDWPGIWRVPVASGEETPVLDRHPAGAFRRWVLTERGIWLITPKTPGDWLIEFFNFTSNKLTTIATLEKMASTPASFEISPDGRWLVWTQTDQSGSDIMLMENFR